MELDLFLKVPRNSVYREVMLKHKLIYDVQLAFAKLGKRIQIYETECDLFGFDLIFDDLTLQRHIQVKSVVKSSMTSSFMIHRNLLRPQPIELNSYPISPDSYGCGYGGGVILTEIEEAGNDLNFNYLYTDGLVLSAFKAELLPFSTKYTRQSSAKCFEDFSSCNTIGGVMRVPKACFIKFKNLSKMLGFCGFQIEDCGSARLNLRRAVAQWAGRPEKAAPRLDVEQWKKYVGTLMEGLPE